MYRKIGAVLAGSVVSLGLLMGLTPQAAGASASVDVETRRVPVETVIPAVGGCNEVFIEIHGTVLVRSRTIVDDAGGTHVEPYAIALQGVTGIGGAGNENPGGRGGAGGAVKQTNGGAERRRTQTGGRPTPTRPPHNNLLFATSPPNPPH